MQKSSNTSPRPGTVSRSPANADSHREEQLRLLLDLSNVVNSATDVGVALNKALQLMADHLHMMRGAITLI